MINKTTKILTNSRSVFLLTAILATTSCKQSNMKFDKSIWIKLDEANSNKLRDRMIDDLRRNHSVIGRSYATIIDSLGSPNKIDSTPTKSIVYVMSMNWRGIDPISGTDYWIYFDSNSIARSDSIVKWEHK